MATQYSILQKSHNLINSFPADGCSECSSPFALIDNNAKTICEPKCMHTSMGRKTKPTFYVFLITPTFVCANDALEAP